jgi:hypothetical protein
MLFKIYKAYVRGAHLTTQKNSPRFAGYFTYAQEGIFWACLMIPVAFFLSLKVFKNNNLIIPIIIILGVVVYLLGKIFNFDKSEFYPQRNTLTKSQIRKEVFIYNAITVFLIFFNSTCIYLIVD